MGVVDVVEDWGGAQALVGLHVADRRSRPGLCFEACQSWKLRLSVAGEPRFWAEDPVWDGAPWFAQDPTKPMPSVVEPIRWSRMRAMAEWDTPLWATPWARWFAEALMRSPVSPLYAGHWRLGTVTVGPLEKAHARAYLPSQSELPMAHSLGEWGTARVAWDDWFAPDGFVVPLRAPLPEDEGRIHAYRKLAKARTLPPVLVLFAAVLARYFVLDGHARMAAAQREGVKPRLLALWPVREGEARTVTTRAWSVSAERWQHGLEGFEGKTKRGIIRPVVRRGWETNP